MPITAILNLLLIVVGIIVGIVWLKSIASWDGYSTNGFDGIYGSGTTSAVKKYQSAHSLTVDGIAGANTFAKLCG